MPQDHPVALVTGVSSGIGLAVAQALHARSFRVFGTSRRAIVGSTSEGIEAIRLDVSDGQSVEAATADVIRRAGRIDVLVNNAGIGIMGGAEESTIEQTKLLFDTNFFGTVRMIKAVLPQMRLQASGRIINISSVLGFLPAPYMAVYAATKHAIEGYSESLDHELRNSGITISLIEPAYTRTSFDRNMLEPDAPLAEYHAVRRHMQRMLMNMMSRADEPEVVARAVLKAATDRRPRMCYPAGSIARKVALLRRFAPASLVDGALRKQLRLRG